MLYKSLIRPSNCLWITGAGMGRAEPPSISVKWSRLMVLTGIKGGGKERIWKEKWPRALTCLFLKDRDELNCKFSPMASLFTN